MLCYGLYIADKKLISNMDKTKVYVIKRISCGGFIGYHSENIIGMVHSKIDADYMCETIGEKYSDYRSCYYKYEEVTSLDAVDKTNKDYRKFVEKRVKSFEDAIKRNEEALAKSDADYAEKAKKLAEELTYYRSLIA